MRLLPLGLVATAMLVPPAMRTATGGGGLQDLQVTIDTQFLTLNDNFYERIGIDFDFSTDDPDELLIEENNQINEMLDLSVSELRTKFEDQGTTLPLSTEFGGGLGIDFAPINGGGSPSEVSVTGGLGITMPGSESGAMLAQAATVIEVNLPQGLTGSVVFETMATFTARIVEPTDGKGATLGSIGFDTFVELVTDPDAFRFSGPEQRFNWSNKSLGPFGGMFDASNDFSLDNGALVFDGENTIQHDIPLEEIEDNLLYYLTRTGVTLDNTGTTLSQIDATGSFAYTLRAVTPGVTFEFATPIPEPGSGWLLVIGALVFGFLVAPRY